MAGPPTSIASLLAGRIRAHLPRELSQLDRIRSYADDPNAFAREVLGIRLWKRQREILETIKNCGRVAIVSGHKIGKLLHPDTPIITPSGWRRFGDLRRGDQVYGSDGQPCTITGTVQWRNRPMMRVHFSDGSWVDADERHEWPIYQRSGRTKRVCETRHLRNSSNHKPSIDLPQPLQWPKRSLPLDPYLLGLWLGDGTTAVGQITSADGLEQAFAHAGFTLGACQRKPDNAASTWTVLGLTRVLRSLGVINNKHAPEVYLFAAPAQRLALLQGLLDSDGHCSPKGRIQFCSTNRRLASAVLFLARSLGISARMHEKRAKLYGRDCGPKFHVEWSHPMAVFRLPRKLTRLRTIYKIKATAHRRVRITRVEALPDRCDSQCIEVDSPDHCFLAGPGMIPTHNSTVLAVAALWFYCSFPKSRVIITATTERQVDGIIWREVRWLVQQAKRRGFVLPGADDIHLVARSGLQDPDNFSEIFGFTAREVEAVAGISAPHMLWLVDEASGVSDRIFEAIFGNMMGGAKIALISNPTRSEGEFANAFLKPTSNYQTLEVSSLETPNCTGDEEPIPGLADPDTIKQVAEQWGTDSPQYKVRVLGKFVVEEEGKIFPFDLREQVVTAWHEGSASEPEGALVISLDPAGESGEGDESCFGVRRGRRLLDLIGKRGLNEAGHVLVLRELIAKHKAHANELPVIILDRDGPIGWKMLNALRSAFKPEEATIIAVRGANKAVRQPQIYETIRDELWANLRGRGREGELELPEDAQLMQELGAPSFEPNVRGRYKVTDKRTLRKLLGRSPDRADCVCLAFWFRDLGEARAEDPDPKPTRDSGWDDGGADPLGIYDGLIDPYG